MHWLDRQNYREEMARWIADMDLSVHLTAMLQPGRSRAQLEGRLQEWVKRVNHRFLGRNWQKPERAAAKLKGFVFFEHGHIGGYPHAHLMVLPPKGTPRLAFLFDAPYLFGLQPSPLYQRTYKRPVAPGGEMYAQLIEDSWLGRYRVARYDAKEIEFSNTPISDWKWIDHLTPDSWRG